VDPEDVWSQPTVLSEARLAQHEAEEDAVVKTQGTYDYLLKTEPSVSSRVLSIVEVKRLYVSFSNDILLAAAICEKCS